MVNSPESTRREKSKKIVVLVLPPDQMDLASEHGQADPPRLDETTPATASTSKSVDGATNVMRVKDDFAETENPADREASIFHTVIIGGKGVGKKSLQDFMPNFNKEGNCMTRKVLTGNLPPKENSLAAAFEAVKKQHDLSRRRCVYLQLTTCNAKDELQSSDPQEATMKADLYIYLFDLTQKSSLEELDQVLVTNKSVPAFLIGNKVDLESKRAIHEADTKSLYEKLNCVHYGEISVHTGASVMQDVWIPLLKIRRDWIIQEKNETTMPGSLATSDPLQPNDPGTSTSGAGSSHMATGASLMDGPGTSTSERDTLHKSEKTKLEGDAQCGDSSLQQKQLSLPAEHVADQESSNSSSQKSTESDDNHGDVSSHPREESALTKSFRKLSTGTKEESEHGEKIAKTLIKDEVKQEKGQEESPKHEGARPKTEKQ